MVYKKYIKRGGKIYGPYKYHSHKVNGKVITEYLGKAEEKNKSKLPLVFLVAGLILLFSLVFILNYNKIDSIKDIKLINSVSGIISSSFSSIKIMTGFAVSDAEKPEQEVDVNLEEEQVTEEAEEQVEEEIEVEEEVEEQIEEIEEIKEPVEEIPIITSDIINESKEIINEIDNESVSEFNLTNTNVNETVSENITIENQTVISEGEPINVSQEILNKTEHAESQIIVNETAEQNFTEVNATESITSITNATIVTVQYQAVMGKPVRWKKTVSLEEPKNLTVKLPAGSKKINIKKINDEEILTSKITGQVIGGEIKGFLSKLLAKIFRLTGRVIGEEKEIEVELDGAKEYEIEYETPAPYAVEEEIEKGKRVKVVGPENIHYENILAYTIITEAPKDAIKLYRTTDGIKEPVQITNYADNNDNGLIDYIEWVVPHLSEQTFEIIIEITKAEHLDISRNFISDIYDEVYQLDDIWSEEIPDGDYVRVTFETELDSSRDITIYPRIVSGTPRVEVYEIDGTEIIAEFTDIISNEYNKIYLTNLVGKQDTFDLRIVGGNLEFDYIVDPIEGLTPIVHVNTEKALVDLDSTEVAAITSDDTDNVMLVKAALLTVEMSELSGTIETLTDANCSLRYFTEAGYPAGSITFKVYASFGGAEIASSTLPASDGVDSLVHLLDLETVGLDAEEVTTMVVYVQNTIGAKGYDLHVDQIFCTIDYEEAVVDDEHPIFSLYKENPLNNSAYSFGATYRFNSTITHTNTTAGVEFAGTNHSAFNSTGTVFNTTVTDLSAGTYSYFWWAYGNGTAHNHNTSGTRYYTIATATPTLTGSVSAELTYGALSDYIGNKSNDGDGNCVYSLKRNGVEIGTDSPVEDTTVLGVGNWNYNYSTTGCANYSAGSDYDSLVVSKAVPSGNLTGTSPIIYGTTGDVNGTESNTGDDDVNYILYRGSIEVSKPDETILGVGTYNYIYNTSGGANWTANASLDTFELIVNKAGDTFDVLLNNVADNETLTYPQQINVTVSNNLTTATIDVNGTTFTSGTNYTLGIGVWFVNVSTVGNQNYTSNESHWYITVNQGDGEVNGTIDGVQGNFTEYNGTATQNIYINATNMTGYGTGKIYVNGSLYNAGTMPLHNVTNLSIGFYNITFEYDGNDNYSSDSEVWWVNITIAGDEEYPQFSDYKENPLNNTVYSFGATYRFNSTITHTNGTAGVEFAGTNHSAFNSTGTVFNTTVTDLSAGTHSYFWWAYGNGTSHNHNTSETRYYTIAKAVPIGNLTNDTAWTRDFDGSATTIELVTSNDGDDDLTYIIYKDNIDVGTSDSQAGAGDYNYVLNTTGGQNYTLNASMDTATLTINSIASSINLTLDGTQGNVTVNQGDSIDLNCSTITGDSGAYLVLYREGNIINNGTTSIGNTTLFDTILTENITCVYEGTQNYTTVSQTWWVDVVDGTSPYFTDNTPQNQTITYDVTLGYNINATDTVGFDCFTVNDTRFKINCSGYLENNTHLGVALYNLNITINDTSNNLNVSYMWVNVTKATPTLSGSVSASLTYGTASDYIGSESDSGDGGCSYSLKREGIEIATGSSVEDTIVLGVGTWNYNYSTTGCINYSAGSDYDTLVVSKAGDTFDVLLNNVADNETLTYPQQINVTVSNNLTTATIDVNGTTFTSGTNYTLGIGVWFVNVSTVGNQNYTSNESHWYITVNQGDGEVFMWINNARENFSAYNTSSSNIWLNATLNAGEGDIELWLNGSLYNSGASPRFNLTNLSLGFYNATAVYSGNANYSSDREIWWINITEAPSDAPPDVSIVYPQNINYNINVSELNYTASDDYGLGKCWRSNSSGVWNSTAQDCGTNWTGLTSVEGSNTWTVYANDSEGQENSHSVTFSKDTINPSVTSMTESPSDPATYSSGASYQFNATITDTNLQTVLIEFDGTNYTPSNISGNVYNFSISDLGVGTYNYYWYVNDSFGNVNNSESDDYTIDKADPSPNMAISGTTPIEYGITSDFSESETNTGDEGCSYSMDRSNIVYGVGVWAFNYSTSGCDNYTAGSITKDLTVSKNTSLSLGLIATTPIEYPTATDFAGSGCPSQLSCSLNISNATYQAGDISANYSTAGNDNYSATSTDFTVTINPNSSYILGISGNTPITYGTATNVVGSDCPSELSSSCSLDKSNIVYGVGESPVTFNYSTPGNTNYTANSITKDITINQAVPTGSLASDLGWTINESQEVIINLSESNTGDDDVTYKVFRDDVDKGTEETWTPPLGAYAYILNTTGGVNYTANLSMDAQTLTVDDITYPQISIAYPVNGTTYTTNISELNYSITETNPGKCWWSNSSGVWNSTTKTCGENWTDLISVEGSNTWTVYINDTSGNENSTFVTFSKDTAYPSVTINSPLNQTYNTNSILFNVTAIDGGDISSCWYTLNSGVTNITMTNVSSEYTDTNSSMSQDSHTVNFYCNDSFNNINNSEVEYFFIDSIYPLIDYESQTKPDNSITSQDFIYVNVTWTEDNFANVTYRLYNSTDEVNTTTYTSTIYDINWTSLPNEVYTYNVTITDIVNNQNTTETRTITLDTTYPQVSIAYPQNTTYATNVSELNYTFTEISPDSCWWSNSSGVWNSTTKTCGENWTDLTSVEGSNTWTVYINDTGGNENSSSVTFFKDSIYPSITGLTEYPEEPTTYSSGQKYEFNATITDTNLEVVLIEFDGTNYTPTNLSGNVYNFTITDLSAGTYNYYWYANDTVNNINNTGIKSYTINNASGDVSLLINDSASNQIAEYGTQTNASASTLYGDVTLYKNGDDITATENNDFVTLGVGYYNYTADSSGDQNHSSATITRFVNITQATSEVNLTLNTTEGNITITQDSFIWLNGTLITGDSSGILKLYNDGIIINEGTVEVSNSTQFSSVGVFNITVIYIESQNYTGSSETWWVNVTEAPDSENPSVTLLTEFPSDPANYSPGQTYEFNATIMDNRNLHTILLEFDGTNYTATNLTTNIYNVTFTDLAVGTYNYSWYANDSAGNTNNSENATYTISQGTPSLSLAITPSTSVTYGTETTATSSGCPEQLTCKLYRNDTTGNISSPDVQTLGVATYNYTYNTTGNANYSSTSVSDILTISQATGVVYTYLNNSRQNKTINQYSSIYLNGTLVTGQAGENIKLYNNGTLINQGTPSLQNLTQFNITGLFNITTIYDGNENYTSAFETWFVNVLEVDITNPNISIVYPANTSYNAIQTQLNYTVSDNQGLDKCWWSINEGVSNETITCGENKTGLDSGQGSSTWTVWTNDTSGNENSSSVTFFVDSIAPEIQFVEPTKTNGSITKENSVYVNVSTSDTNEHSAFIDWNRSLVGWWKFDEYNATGIYDNSTYDNFGKFSNGLSMSDITIGKRGKALEFDGENDYVEISDSDSLNFGTRDFSVGVWFRDNSGGSTDNYILTKGIGWLGHGAVNVVYSLEHSFTGELSFVVGNGTVLNRAIDYSTTYFDGEWHHMVGVKNSEGLYLYVDGKLEATGNPVGGNTSNSNALLLGVDYDEVGSNFNGTIDEVMIFNRALSPAEINASYNARLYKLYHNFTNLNAGIYDYTAHVIDITGNVNQTETRTINLTIPTLTINKPKNKTYIANTSLVLKYTANYEEAVWYNLDVEENTTISSSVYFNTSEGSHTLYLYANNSLGTITKNVTFFINLTQFTIYFDEYNDIYRGNSTNFNEYPCDEIQNLSNIILENTAYGKIKFNNAINLTDDANVSDNEADLDTYINISDKKIELNSDALPNFNKNATLYLYNLTFSNPRILRDGSACPATICTKESYIGGASKTLKFNVTGFTIYSAEETPSAVVPVSDGAGPSGGGSAECRKDSDCKEKDEICWKSRCVQLFDIKIIDFESPAQLGDFFEFTYFAKGMANINTDVEVRFWIEKNKEVITSGSDIMYFGSFEEKTETTKIFLPSNLESGFYEFYVQIIHEAYTVSSHRTIEIQVKEGGLAIIKAVDKKYPKLYLILVLIIAFLFILVLIHILWGKRLKKKRNRKKGKK